MCKKKQQQSDASSIIKLSRVQLEIMSKAIVVQTELFNVKGLNAETFRIAPDEIPSCERDN